MDVTPHLCNGFVSCNYIRDDFYSFMHNTSKFTVYCITQVENLVDEAFKHRDFQALEKFLQNESKEEISLKCSRQFMTKLDKLFNRVSYLSNIAYMT